MLMKETIDWEYHTSCGYGTNILLHGNRISFMDYSFYVDTESAQNSQNSPGSSKCLYSWEESPSHDRSVYSV